MKLRLLLAAALLLILGACGSPRGGTARATTLIDYIDFFTWGGRTYVAAVWSAGRPLTDADLGPEQFHVQKELSTSDVGASYRPVDGDAAFLPRGESVYAVRGYKTSFRLAAHREGHPVLYEVDSNPRARAGQDLLDIGGRVRTIAVISKTDGHTVLARIGDPARISRLVGLALDAPVDTHRESGQLAAFVSFQLEDGTATTRAYFSEIPMLGRGILVPREFAAAVDPMVATAPTPTPIPAMVNFAQRYGLAGAVRVYIKRIPPPAGEVQDPSRVQQFVAALNVDLPTVRPRPTLPSDYTVLGFEFGDRYVAFAYDPPANTLVVVAPPDNLAVHPTQQLRDLLAAPLG